QVLPAGAVLVLATPVLAASGAQVPRVGQIEQGGEPRVDGQDDVTAVAAITAVRAAAGDVLLAPEADAAPPAVAGFDPDSHFVHEPHDARAWYPKAAPGSTHSSGGSLPAPSIDRTFEAL